MEKYYVIGLTNNDIVQGGLFKLQDQWSKITFNNLKEVQDLASKGIRPIQQAELKAFALNSFLSSNNEEYEEKYGQYADVTFINETLKQAMDSNGFNYNYIGSAMENELPENMATLLKMTHFIY